MRSLVGQTDSMWLVTPSVEETSGVDDATTQLSNPEDLKPQMSHRLRVLENRVLRTYLGVGGGNNKHETGDNCLRTSFMFCAFTRIGRRWCGWNLEGKTGHRTRMETRGCGGNHERRMRE